MKLTIKMFCLILMIAINTAVCYAQTIKSNVRLSRSLSDVGKDSFASLECKFSIKLPERVNITRPDTCETFQWHMKEGFYGVGYKDSEQSIEDSNAAENELLNAAKDALKNLAKYTIENPDGEFKTKTKSFSFEAHRGIEIRIEMPNGLSIARAFAIKNRVYTLAVSVVGEQMKDKDDAIKVLDSFKFLSQKNIDEIVAKKLEAATPKPFPQEPVAKRAKSDAEDEGLKGKVKLVVEQRYTYNKKQEKILNGSSEIYYNEQGNRIKEIVYRYDGFPAYITAYGYIDGNRVSTTAYIYYATNVGGALPPPLTPPTNPPDKRYQTKYEYKYDESGKLVEELTYYNNGSLATREEYKRNGNQIETTSYFIGFNNELKTSRGTYVIDEQGNIIEGSLGLTPGTFKRVYTYEFDEKRNWTRKIESYVQELNGTKTSELKYEKVHKIIYY